MMSPCFIRALTPEGLQPVAYTADSMTEAARYEPQDAAYTVTNTYHTFQVLKFDAHLDRLEDSARREGIPLALDRPRLRMALRAMIAEAGYGDVRFRITVPCAQPDHLILSLEPFQPPAPEVYEQGVKCITLADSARDNPAAKSTAWMHERERFALPPGVYTGLLLDSEGNILEGLSSNFYAVLAGELRTAGEGVLPGIAQQIVFEIAPGVLPLRKDAVNLRNLPRLSEAFITSSSRGIVPVVQIDGVTIGAGVPGQHTQALMTAYRDWVARHLEEL
ncbi:MAG: aminotransferase class IV family protein [Chloroflexi bacterium]|nr:aminotransferase class IV family protein [Chloroflexota bacterium]